MRHRDLPLLYEYFRPTDIPGLQAWYDASRLQIGAAQFNAAISQYLSVADHADIQAGDVDWSWAGHVRLEDGAYRIINKEDPLVSGDIDYSLRYSSPSLIAAFKSTSLVSASANITEGSWHFVVFWHDAAADTLNLQVDNGAVTSTPTGGVAPPVTGSSMYFGCRSDLVSFLSGRMAKVGFWKKVLSAAEVASLYNSGAGLYHSQLSGSLLTSLISYWNLNEASGQRNDSTANAHHLTDNNTVSCAPSMTPETPADGTLVYIWEDLSGNGNHATQATEGVKPVYKVNIVNGRPVVRFDGSNDYLNMADSLGIFRNVPGATIVAVYDIAASTATGQRVLSATTPAGSTRAALIVEQTAGKTSFGGRRLDADGFQEVVGPDLLLTTFTVDVGVFDYANALAYFYRNGVLVGSADPFQTAGNTSNTDSLAVTIGANNTGGEPTQGDVKALLAFNRTLTAAERARIARYYGRDCGIAIA